MHVRRLRDPGARAGLDHQPPDRGRPYRDDPLHQARRQGLDQRLPRQARHPEAGRDPHGLGQGQPGALGRGGEAGPGACSSSPGVPEPTAREAMRLAMHKLPIKTRFVVRTRTESVTMSRTASWSSVRAQRRRAGASGSAEAKEELFNLRFQNATGQLDNTARLERVRQDDRARSRRSCASARSRRPRRAKRSTTNGRRRPTRPRQPPQGPRGHRRVDEDGQDGRRRGRRPRAAPPLRQDAAAHAQLYAHDEANDAARATAFASPRPARSRSRSAGASSKCWRA